MAAVPKAAGRRGRERTVHWERGEGLLGWEEGRREDCPQCRAAGKKGGMEREWWGTIHQSTRKRGKGRCLFVSAMKRRKEDL